jgi:hypothetical protein
MRLDGLAPLFLVLLQLIDVGVHVVSIAQGFLGPLRC